MTHMDGQAGYQGIATSANEYNRMTFAFWSLMARVRTCTLVRVEAVTNSGEDIPAGFVDILPLVNQLDGIGQKEEHRIIYKCPYFRLLGGGNAVILDPQVGDIGLACFADRDISSVVATQRQSNPGSYRMFDMSDGLYVGGLFGETPTQFVRFSTDGITVKSPTKVTVLAPAIELDNGGTLQKLLNEAAATVFNSHTHNAPGGGGTTSGPSASMGAPQETSVLKAE